MEPLDFPDVWDDGDRSYDKWVEDGEPDDGLYFEWGESPNDGPFPNELVCSKDACWCNSDECEAIEWP